MSTGVYVIRNFFGGEEYIGSAMQGFRRRWNEHIRKLARNEHHNWFMQAAYNHFGPGALQFSILQECSKEHCVKNEQKWMTVLKPEMNILKFAGSPGAGRVQSAEERAMRGALFSGEKNPFFGRRHSDESLAKMRAAKTGKKCTQETKAKVSASLMGNKRTLGRKVSLEEKAERKAILNRPETKIKMSQSQKARWAIRKSQPQQL